MDSEGKAAGNGATVSGEGRVSYDRSTISFPYFDLSESVRLATAMSANVGKDEASDDQLAAWVEFSPKSSGYRARIASARTFGILEQGSVGDHRLTDLGLKVVSDDHSRAGLAEAFLRVPLFKRVYEQWQGQQLPPAASLERAMIQMGVANKQAARARQVLERSATRAGFFENGRDRLVPPGIRQSEVSEPANQAEVVSDDEFSAEWSNGVDPIIRGLLQRLPPSGSVWAEDERQLWLDLLKGSFKLIYRDKEDSRLSPEEKTMLG